MWFAAIILKLVAGQGNAPCSILAYEARVRLSEPAIKLNECHLLRTRESNSASHGLTVQPMHLARVLRNE
jgi:hypothetical protein